MAQHRIVSNGIEYRVQWLGKTFFFQKPKWYWVIREDPYGEDIAEFSSSEKAQDAIDKIERRDAADKQGYVPIAGED